MIKIGFEVIINSREELIKGLKALKEIGALGSSICFGTYMPDSCPVEDLFDENDNTWVEPKDRCRDDVHSFCIGYDKDEDRNDIFPTLYGRNHVIVSFSTVYDFEEGDVYGNTVLFDDMISETLKLLEIDNLAQNEKRNN